MGMQENTQSFNDQNTDLMNDIIAIRDDLWAKNDIIAGELSEEFAMLDPDLTALHKDMKSAAAQLSNAKQTNGMTDMLKWRFESMESAYQTRLLEVRRNKLLANNKVVDKEEQQQKRELHELSMQQTMNDQFAALREKRLKEKRRKEKSSSGGFLFYFLLGLWLANMQRNQRLEQDRARNAFSNARLSHM